MNNNLLDIMKEKLDLMIESDRIRLTHVFIRDINESLRAIVGWVIKEVEK